MKALILVAATLFTVAALSAQTPEISFDSASNVLKLPAHTHLGEVAGVATNSKGNIFVYTRTGADATMGGSRVFTHGGSRLFEFDAKGTFVREIGTGVYGMLFAETVRIDPQDNIWVVDRGSNMVLKFSPDGRLAMTMGRKPESVNLGPAGGVGRGPSGPVGAGVPGDNFNRPTDVAWDAAGNIFVSDGYGNARVAKYDKNGKFLKSWGSKGSESSQFDTPHSLAVDSQGNVYVADQGNKRIQVFDNDGNFKTAIANVGAPWAICISPGAHPYLYSSNSNDPESLDNGEIYKMELDGKILGKFGRAGKLPKEFGTVNQIDCRSSNVLYVAEVQNWRVQKLSLH
ncbi:MAG: peptidyl-alpha-hydroxyglycine alpha-amidating lyase family protein [Acidobacteria bacterium]|nr:peptidyl-alpha-hydroxyglycine alpha-amidating lyase family protein [Acidobacteriota bacterium]